MKYNLQENIGKQIEVFTKLRDKNKSGTWGDFYSKSQHKGVIFKEDNKFYCQCNMYRFPLYQDNSREEEFGINTKYVITL
jgi:hypothetical protein